MCGRGGGVAVGERSDRVAEAGAGTPCRYDTTTRTAPTLKPFSITVVRKRPHTAPMPHLRALLRRRVLDECGAARAARQLGRVDAGQLALHHPLQRSRRLRNRLLHILLIGPCERLG